MAATAFPKTTTCIQCGIASPPICRKTGPANRGPPICRAMRMQCFLAHIYYHLQGTCKEQAAGFLDTMLQPAEAINLGTRAAAAGGRTKTPASRTENLTSISPLQVDRFAQGGPPGSLGGNAQRPKRTDGKPLAENPWRISAIPSSNWCRSPACAGGIPAGQCSIIFGRISTPKGFHSRGSCRSSRYASASAS